MGVDITRPPSIRGKNLLLKRHERRDGRLSQVLEWRKQQWIEMAVMNNSWRHQRNTGPRTFNRSRCDTSDRRGCAVCMGWRMKRGRRRPKEKWAEDKSMRMRLGRLPSCKRLLIDSFKTTPNSIRLSPSSHSLVTPFTRQSHPQPLLLLAHVAH